MTTNLLRVSEAASLALHTAVLLAASEELVSASHIAQRLGVSQAHLAKVLGRLGHVGLVDSVRGPKGGFRLQRKPQDVTLLEVYEAIEGPLQPPGCLLGKRVCTGADCVLGKLVASVDEQVRRHLSTTHLSDLAGLYGEEHAAQDHSH